jgi:UPF0042 nucleotide-binding protein
MTEVLLVTGMAGAGKTTVLKTLEDLGWETVDNIPLSLLSRVVLGPDAQPSQHAMRPIAFGVGARTRDFDPEALIRRVEQLRTIDGVSVEVLFLDCSGRELARRYAETRRRHPLAEDRPASEGIAQERTLLAPLRSWSDRLIDTTRLKANALAQDIRRAFERDSGGTTTLIVESFGFSRGVPTAVDLVFDMRFLRNPHWEPGLRARTGKEAVVADYIASDPAYDEALTRIEDLLLLLLPRYHAEGKPYVTIAFGCTGGKHRSVHVAERVGLRLRNAGFSPTITHRDLPGHAQDAIEERPQGQ